MAVLMGLMTISYPPQAASTPVQATESTPANEAFPEFLNTDRDLGALDHADTRPLDPAAARLRQFLNSLPGHRLSHLGKVRSREDIEKIRQMLGNNPGNVEGLSVFTRAAPAPALAPVQEPNCFVELRVNQDNQGQDQFSLKVSGPRPNPNAKCVAVGSWVL